MSKGRHRPTRMCVYCRKRYPKDRLRRFVAQEGYIREDINGKIQARGAYVCTSNGCSARLDREAGGYGPLKKALKIKKFLSDGV